MAKPVAVVGDVQAIPASSPSFYGQPTWNGSWMAEPVSESSYPKLTVNGVRVVYEVRCTFKFNGSDSSTNPPTAVLDKPSQVTLTARATVLQNGNGNVLVEGDSERDDHGNELVARPAGHLSTQ